MPLQALLSEATRYAEFCLGNTGQVPPTMFAQTDKGTLIFMPDGMKDAQAKDDFVTKARLIAATYGASDVVLVLESWVTMANKGEKLDTTPPSESHERQEMIVLIGEGKEEHRSRFLPVIRSDNGNFWNPQDQDSSGGRFQDLLPPIPPDEEMRQMGMKLLEELGVKVGKIERDG